MPAVTRCSCPPAARHVRSFRGACSVGGRTTARAVAAAATAAVLVLAAACAPAVRLVASPPSPACGAAVTPDNRPLASPIAWLRPHRAEERARLDRWCASVGPAIVTAMGPAAHPAVDRLAVVSWNVHVGGGDIERLVRDLRDGRLTGGHRPDAIVLLLQETFRAGPLPALRPGMPVPYRIAPRPAGGPRTGIRALARTLGLRVYYVPSMRNGREPPGAPAEDRGSAIVSTLPLADLRALELPFERQRRVTIAATVTTATRSGRAWTIGLANVHLENRAGRRRWWVRSGAARTRQARALAGALPASGPLVLGGDLNTWLGAEAALRVIGSSLGDRTLGTRAAGEPRLDFLFARLPEGWRLTTSTVRDPYGSDHRPVVGLIDVGQ